MCRGSAGQGGGCSAAHLCAAAQRPSTRRGRPPAALEGNTQLARGCLFCSARQGVLQQGKEAVSRQQVAGSMPSMAAVTSSPDGWFDMTEQIKTTKEQAV